MKSCAACGCHWGRKSGSVTTEPPHSSATEKSKYLSVAASSNISENYK
ncbi:unnamed protein product, partial [Amoebophrya sp. A120]|eukprot:GSA120T00022331001.1